MGEGGAGPSQLQLSVASRAKVRLQDSRTAASPSGNEVKRSVRPFPEPGSVGNDEAQEPSGLRLYYHKEAQ